MPPPSEPFPSDASHANDTISNDYLLTLPGWKANDDALRFPHDHDKHISRSVHSPTPQRGYLLPYAYELQGSRSSQDIGKLPMEDCNYNATNLQSHRAARLPSCSAISLPLSHHGLVRMASRPNSCASQPIRISNTPTPVSVNMAPPTYSPANSPPPPRTVLPISTASVQRWNRQITVYVTLFRSSLPWWLIYGTQPHKRNILPRRSLEIQIRRVRSPYIIY
jgi:hypothetical protein